MKDVFTEFEPRITSGITISMTEKGSNYGYSFWEIRVWSGGENIASQGKVQASSSEELSFDGCVREECAIDDNLKTRWGSDYGAANDQLSKFEITFSQPKKVDRIELEWQLAYAKYYCVIIH